MWVHVAMLLVLIWVPKIAYSLRNYCYDNMTYIVPDIWSNAPDPAQSNTVSSNHHSSDSSDAIFKGVLHGYKWIVSCAQRIIAFEFLPWLYEVFFNSVALFARRWHDFEVHYPASLWERYYQAHGTFNNNAAVGGTTAKNVNMFSNDKQCPLPRNCLLVGYHSRPTLDLIYTIAHIRPAALVSQLFFEVPFMDGIMKQGHFMSSSKPGRSADATFYRAVTSGSRPVLLLPGGAYECAKDCDQKYKVQWKRIPGFARVLLSKDLEYNHRHHLSSHDDASINSATDSNNNDRHETANKSVPIKTARHTPVIPFFVANCEDILYTTDYWYAMSGQYVRNALNELRERGVLYKLPLIMFIAFFCMGCHLLPKPVKLDLYFGDPVTSLDGESEEQFAARVTEAMQTLIDSSMTRSNKDGNKNSCSTSGGGGGVHESRSVVSKIRQYPVYALYTFIQNTLIVIYCVAVFIFVVPFGVLVQYLIKWARHAYKTLCFKFKLA